MPSFDPADHGAVPDFVLEVLSGIVAGGSTDSKGNPHSDQASSSTQSPRRPGSTGSSKNARAKARHLDREGQAVLRAVQAFQEEAAVVMQVWGCALCCKCLTLPGGFASC